MRTTSKREQLPGLKTPLQPVLPSEVTAMKTTPLAIQNENDSLQRRCLGCVSHPGIPWGPCLCVVRGGEVNHKHLFTVVLPSAPRTVYLREHKKDLTSHAADRRKREFPGVACTLLK